MAARAAGANLRILGAVMAHSPLGLAALRTSAIAEPADLVGRVLGAGTLHDRPLLDALFAANGLDNDYELRTVDSGFDSLASGYVDVLSCSTINQVPAARDAGLDVDAWTFAQLGLAMPGDLIVCTAQWALSHDDAAASFLRASAKGWQRQLESPEAGGLLTWERFGSSWDLDRGQCVREAVLQAELMSGAVRPLEIDQAELSRASDLLAEAMGIDLVRVT